MTNCDYCNKDDWDSGIKLNLRLAVTGTVFENKTATVYFNFCDLNCLSSWLKNKMERMKGGTKTV